MLLGAAFSAAGSIPIPGFYATGTFGYGKTDLSDGDITKNTGFLWNAAGGYRFNKYFGTEAGYLSLPNVKIKNRKVKPSAFYAALKAIYPFNDAFDVFAKAGVGYTSVSLNGASLNGISKHRFIPLFGLGLDYNLGPNLALTVQGITTLKSGHSFPATYGGLVGLTYTF